MAMKILQFGEGNFLRCFFDWMLQKVSDATGREYLVTLVQPIPKGAALKIASAGFCHALLRGWEDGQYVERLDRIAVFERGIDPFSNPDALRDCARDPEYALCVSNTTEAGIFYEAGHDRPHNYPSFLADFLYHRMKAGLEPPMIMPFELIDRNGDKLRSAVELYASERGYEADFFAWLGRAGIYNTLVDRIVPGYPADAAERVEARLGFKDPYLTSGELFHLLVIEGDSAIAELIPFAEAGLNVVVTPDNLAFYRDRKVRILNGCHTASVGVALFAGVEEVDKFASHEKYGLWMNALAHEEIAYAMGGGEETGDYAREVIERFRNPALGHSFRSIALNSLAKSNTRLRPTLEDYRARTGKLPPRLTEGIAALVRLYLGGPTNGALPGGPLALSDWGDITGSSVEDILRAMFPGLDSEIMEALANETCIRNLAL